MSEWRETTLGEVCEVVIGRQRSPKHAAGDYVIPYMRAANVKDGRVLIDDVLEMNFTPAERLVYCLQDGDVLVTEGCGSAAELGASAQWQCQLDGPVAMQNTLLRLRFVDQKSDPNFLHAFARNAHHSGKWLQVSSGTSILHVGLLRARSMPVKFPAFDTQVTIGRHLRAIDDLLKNNRRRIELLEQMAQAIYREWFVQFRYPGHEDATFIDSPLGPIPEGWRTNRVDQVARLVRGRSYRKDELVEDGGVPFVNLKCMMRGGGFRRDGLKRYLGKHTIDQRVIEGDIVLAVTDLTQGREILARATLVPRLRDEFGVISLDVVRLVANDPADRLALLFALRATDFPDRVKEFANGSTVLHLSPNHVAAGEIVWAAEGLRRRFVAVVEPMINEVNDLTDAAENLAAMRDLLLPKLVTGQIDVSSLDLDALVGSVA